MILIALAIVLGWLWVALALAIVLVALLSFFRDPPRRIRADLPPGTMLSPADGCISAIEYVDEHDALDGKGVIIRIFLSVLNVHVNRWPYDAEVLDMRYTPGKFLNAQTEESARVNESNLILLSAHHPNGETERIGVRQVAGMIARRIVCPIERGQSCTRGARFGMITFGSTTELILPRPDDVQVHVKVGQRVRGGLTLLATISPPGAATAESQPD